MASSRLPAQVILLAGGQGRRAGGPKATKLVDGRPWWRLQREAIAADAGPVVVVLHPDAWQAAEPPQGDEPCAMADPDGPPFDSLQRGLALCDAALPALLLPIDCPWPGAEVARALCAAIEPGLLAARPTAVQRDGVRRDGVRRGHPVLLMPAAMAHLAKLDPGSARLDVWLREQGSAVADVAVDDPRILANFNLDGVTR